MNVIPDIVTALAFDLKEGEALNDEQQDIQDEWTSGRAAEYMKLSSNDPMVLRYMAIFDECENKKAAIWNRDKH